MRGAFHECGRQPNTDDRLYRELVLTDSDAMTSSVVYCRHSDYQAVTECRLPASAVLADGECGGNTQAKKLLMATGSSAQEDAPHRYDRIIILQNGPADDIRGVIRCLANRRPRLLREGRVFVVHLPDGAELDEQIYDALLGRCQAVTDVE